MRAPRHHQIRKFTYVAFLLLMFSIFFIFSYMWKLHTPTYIIKLCENSFSHKWNKQKTKAKFSLLLNTWIKIKLFEVNYILNHLSFRHFAILLERILLIETKFEVEANGNKKLKTYRVLAKNRFSQTIV
ncbi:hypothetical protein ACKWTF_000687 [Chironomus riparius]